MDFEFSDEQNMLREQFSKLLEAKCTVDEVRRILDTPEQYSKTLWREVAGMGGTAIIVPEHYGGLNLGGIYLCVIAEELGRVVAPLPFSSSVYLATEALLLAGSDALKQQYLPGLADGSAIGTLAVSEFPHTIDNGPAAVSYHQGLLSGGKFAVSDGSYADFAIVSAQAESGSTSLFVVDLQQDSVQRETVATLDASRDFANLYFDAAAARPLGEPGSGAAILTKLYNRAAIYLAFEQLGGAQAALDMAVAYVKERYAFGRPIGSFQAIKHKLADVYCLVELARSNAYYAAWALSDAESGASDRIVDPIAAAAARLSAGKAYYQASKENIHVHGGVGFTWEFDCHLHYRRSKVLSQLVGGQHKWRKHLMQCVRAVGGV